MPLYLSFRSFIRDMRHNSLLAVPAALYAVNNYLKFALQLFFRCAHALAIMWCISGHGNVVQLQSSAVTPWY